MPLLDRLEKTARIALWLALAALCSIAPVGLVMQAQNEAREAARREAAAADAAKAAAAAAAELREASVPQRLMVADMKPALSALNRSEARGALWFSNVSRRGGVVCVQGTATGESDSTVSLPSCVEVKPYETNVKVEMMFAGAVLDRVCKGDSPCRLTVDDVPDSEAPVASQ